MNVKGNQQQQGQQQGRPANKGQPSSQKPSSAANPNKSGKAAAAAPTAQQEKKKHIVILKNCENDFSRIHTEALVPYLGLAKGRLGRKAALLDGQQPDDAAANALAYYELACRSETRSAEIRVYGNADTVMKCFSCAQATQIPKHADKQQAGGPKRARDNATKSAAAEEEEADAADPVAGEEDGEPAKKKGPVGAPRFGTVEDMVAVMKAKPYFTHPPVFHVSSGDAVETVEGETEGGSSTTATRVTSSAQLVSCVASTSVPQSPKQLRKVLADVPGFVSCWTLHALHFRVVFASKAQLFAAKSLLDAFEADSGNRVTLKLPDSLARDYTEHLQA